MGTTKDRILEVSLRLFARDGFEAVSTSAIAGELGMTKSALYKHFPDKRAIFNCLVDDMLEQHRTTVIEAGISIDSDAGVVRAYASSSPEEMANLGEALFRHWTMDESACAFRRMLLLERFRDDLAARVYDEFFLTGQLAYHQAMFSEMVEIGAFYQGDTVQMALDFWAPIYLLMQATDAGMDTQEAVGRVRAHVLTFAKLHVRSHNG